MAGAKRGSAVALIDVVKWEAGADELVWKFPNSELSTLTQLIVNESQTAILFKDGRRLDSFGAGRHTLSTNNLPLLNKLVNLPFGGKSPFAAEVWFVNQAIPLDLKWGTPTPIQLEDPQYGLVVPVSAFGQMGVRISDPGMFVGTLVGTLRSFTTRAVLDYFKGVLVSQLRASIAKAVIKRQTPILQIEAELITLSEEIQRDIAPHYERFGLEVHLFRIMSISIPDDDPGVLELKKAKAAAVRRKIEGTNYAQERTFDALQAGAQNTGMGGAFAGIGAGLAIGQVMGQVGMQQMAPPVQVPVAAGPPPFGGFGAPPAATYHVHVNGQQQGPVLFEQMKQAAANGQLRPDTPVWRAGQPGWETAANLPELAALFAPQPPPFGGFGGPPAGGGPPPFGGIK
jgi:membrane protease subunit (stomatin/prohibitin family)